MSGLPLPKVVKPTKKDFFCKTFLPPSHLLPPSLITVRRNKVQKILYLTLKGHMSLGCPLNIFVFVFVFLLVRSGCPYWHYWLIFNSGHLICIAIGLSCFTNPLPLSVQSDWERMDKFTYIGWYQLSIVVSKVKCH